MTLLFFVVLPVALFFALALLLFIALALLFFVALLVLARPRVVAGRVVRVHRRRGFIIPAPGSALGPIRVASGPLCRENTRRRAVVTLAIGLLVSWITILSFCRARHHRRLHVGIVAARSLFASRRLLT